MYCVPISSHFSHMGEILSGLPKGQETLMAFENPVENNAMVAMKKYKCTLLDTNT